MTLFDNAIVFAIIAFLILITWSRAMGQSMGETLTEIREFIQGWTLNTE